MSLQEAVVLAAGQGGRRPGTGLQGLLRGDLSYSQSRPRAAIYQRQLSGSEHAGVDVPGVVAS